MTIDRMTLQGLVEKAPDADFLREMIEVISNRLMQMEVEGLTGAGHGERSATASAMIHRSPARALRRHDHGPSHHEFAAMTSLLHHCQGHDRSLSRSRRPNRCRSRSSYRHLRWATANESAPPHLHRIVARYDQR